MKQVWAILLAALMALSLAACGGGGADTPEGAEYDAEFTIYVNGSDEWTPFEGKSGVAFDYSGSVISMTSDATTVSFTGKQVGEAVITAAVEGEQSRALVRVRAMEPDEDEIRIDYNYDPPQDNFCIEIRYYEAGETYNDIYAKIGAEEAGIYGYTGWQEFYNITTGEYYTVVDGMWYDDVLWGFDSFADMGHNPPITEFNEFVAALRQMGFDNGKLADFYVGTEIVCGVECWVFDTDGWNGQYVKYWVDPANGCALKKAGTTTDAVYEVVRYELDYTEWDEFFIPG
ncbi:MAG: hypothetical protein Q4B99_00660 [Clostridia bacterium]|nr:hypothetical protein [Clostridia bacterium]